MAVLHGFGGNFCAGYDLEELAGLDKDQVDYLSSLYGLLYIHLFVTNVHLCTI